MSGHAKWATTKHKKAVVDARRGKLFAKLIKTVEVAARTGGGDPAGNPTLYDAIQKAKKSSVPNENIDRAVRRGAALEAGRATYEAAAYEGYAPGRGAGGGHRLRVGGRRVPALGRGAAGRGPREEGVPADRGRGGLRRRAGRLRELLGVRRRDGEARLTRGHPPAAPG